MGAVRKKVDQSVRAIKKSLDKYKKQHTDSKIKVYRQNSASIRARIVDPDFDGVNKADRHEIVWNFLQDLPENQQSEISVLLLLTPNEVESSFANLDFDNPIPSRL